MRRFKSVLYFPQVLKCSLNLPVCFGSQRQDRTWWLDFRETEKVGNDIHDAETAVGFEQVPKRCESCIYAFCLSIVSALRSARQRQSGVGKKSCNHAVPGIGTSQQCIRSPQSPL